MSTGVRQNTEVVARGRGVERAVSSFPFPHVAGLPKETPSATTSSEGPLSYHQSQWAWDGFPLRFLSRLSEALCWNSCHLQAVCGLIEMTFQPLKEKKKKKATQFLPKVCVTSKNPVPTSSDSLNLSPF